VYYALSGKQIILLLLGGDKRKQQADIKQAKEYWRDYQERTKAKGKRKR
jgi:putative addiction module killer protein